MKVPIDLPFCLFLMFIMFLSLAPPREANGRRAGEAMVVTVVMSKCCLKGRMLLLCLRLRNVVMGNAGICLLAEYSVEVPWVGQGLQRGEDDVVDEEDMEVSR